MNPVAVKIAMQIAAEAYKHRKKIIITIFIMLIFLFILFTAIFSSSDESRSDYPNINDEVMAFHPVVSSFAMQYGIPEYTDIILAIIMIETEGKKLDIMQSSQSLGLSANAITDPIQSIDAGVKHLSEMISDAEKKGLDYWTPIQSYNFGGGFNDYVESNGKQYTFDLSSNFAASKSNNKVVPYQNPVASFNGYWRYSYGNMYYVKLIQQFIGGASDIGNVDASPLGGDNYQALMSEALRYDGWPYQWGGQSPGTSFDCSGLTQYVYNSISYGLPRTAAEQYNATIRVAEPQPGDLVFFKGTNPSRPANSITHVGIYVDHNRMFDASSSGIGYHSWSSGYWSKHFAGFGRVLK